MREAVRASRCSELLVTNRCSKLHNQSLQTVQALTDGARWCFLSPFQKISRAKHTPEAIQRVPDAARSGANWTIVATFNGINKRTAWGWVALARNTDNWTAPTPRRGGFRHRKITAAHVDFLANRLADNCNLTVKEMAELLDDEFSVAMSSEMVRRALSGACFTLKKTHRDNGYRSSLVSKEKHRQYVIDLYCQIGMGKKVFYMDEANFNLWCARSYGWSKSGERAVENNPTGKGKNIHVIACVSEHGLEYSESRFGSFTAVKRNAFVERLLRHIVQSHDLSEVVLVVDNAPCYTSVEGITRDDEFAAAAILKLGPYSPMLNPIENMFSTYKSAVKRFLARNRAAIKQVPPHLTIVEHRSRFLQIAADLILPEVVTEELCRSCSRHIAPFHVMALDRLDMPVGE